MTNYDTASDGSEPRVLIFDIECTPFTAYSWGPKFNVNLIEYIEPWHLLCFAYKWYGEDEVKVISQRQFSRDYKRNRRDDRRVAQELWALFDEADIVIGHNGDQFDIKKANARFSIHGLGRPSPSHTVDTKKVAQRSFSFGSNSLKDLGAFLSLGTKLPHTGFDLWTGCMAGDEDSWDLMEAYNIQDVVLLEQVYEKFLLEGWILNHPNIASIKGMHDGCPNCGSSERVRRGTRTTKTGAYRYPRYKCKNCNSWYRGSASIPGSRNQSRAI